MFGILKMRKKRREKCPKTNKSIFILLDYVLKDKMTKVIIANFVDKRKTSRDQCENQEEREREKVEKF